MKIDLYTKSILTVIAACLLFSTAKSFIGPAQAQSGPVKVDIVAVNGVGFAPLAVRIVP